MSNLIGKKDRPVFHFTPPSGWLNDPNGLVFLDGEYHLFYQHHPHDLVWGPMHWGHAVSRDLIHWDHLPIALYPDEKGFIFSGSAVIDHRNTAGFGAGAMVAIFTLHTGQGETQQQSQGIAYSQDGGRTWRKYEGNPVIEAPAGLKDFRDPKVIWYGPPETGHWVMALTVFDRVWIYISADLINWEKTDEFGQGVGCHAGVWECPDLFEMTVMGGGQSRWVMLVSVQDGAPAGGNGVQYFVGEFDGRCFTVDPHHSETRWADYGPDYYAAVTWNNEPAGRRIIVGWMNNWPYSNKIPATQWRGMMSVPRELSLMVHGGDVVLQQRPVREMDGIWTSIYQVERLTIQPEIGHQPNIKGVSARIQITFEVDEETTADFFGLYLRQGHGCQTAIIYDRQRGTIGIDRRQSGQTLPEMAQNAPHEAELMPENGLINLEILLDLHSVELFAHGGRLVMSELIFSPEEAAGMSIFTSGGEVVVKKMLVQIKDDRQQTTDRREL
ncbi:MAG: glycoside hydrolase family 32 protein [Ardenticatenaceae bacterium]|nr:glycoside hydrolase family 32 protein [Ardenticatenaceae bacterium]